MDKIVSIEGRKIFDSRGKPTIEVKVGTSGGMVAIDSVPSGTSRGSHEATLLSADQALISVNKTIAPQLLGKDVLRQKENDEIMIELDGTENKSRLGANAILGVSLATARAAALSQKKPLFWYLNKLFREISGLEVEPKIPTPMMVMLCGGKHARNKLCIQEFSVLGEMADGIRIWRAVQELLQEKKIPFSMGLEGAFAPENLNDEQTLEILSEGLEKARPRLAGEVKLGLDIAGNHCQLSNEQILNFFQKFNLFSLEDPFDENDWERFGQLKLELEELKKPYLLIGDDIFATHKSLLEKGVTHLVASGIIIKPNQVGTLTEVFEVLKIAIQANFTLVVSHRSGETFDSFIADLAVATGADYLKSGAPVPNERLLKYKRLKEIGEEL